jgi:hypothetical protein
MRPILMVEGLNNLHDARYCAAVGIGLATFDLDSKSATCLAPAVVKEILDWLSGLEGVGSFGNEPGSAVAERAKAASVGRVMVPIGSDLDHAGLCSLPKIFDCSGELFSESLLQRIQFVGGQHPDALFLLVAKLGATEQWAEGIPISRCILRYDSPDAVLVEVEVHRLRPYGFSLGAFAKDSEGILDYDVCDAFTASYFQLDFA